MAPGPALPAADEALGLVATAMEKAFVAMA